MTSVAGDFYDFIEISPHEAGFLIADVSGHGVPAALIASMIKIAMQSVIDAAKYPGEVLSQLGKILGSQLHGQFVTAAYLYIDSEKYISQICSSRSSAITLLEFFCWKASSRSKAMVCFLEFQQRQNILCVGFTFNKNDRFLLYTDGLTETRNAAGDEFGNKRLDELISSNRKILLQMS